MNNPLAFVIEDDQKQASIFKLALDLADFEVESINNGITALEKLSSTTPSLVVLDLHLPQASGTQVFQYIKAEARLRKTKIIVATADPLRAERLRADVDLVLIKPVSFDQLSELASRLRPADPL